MDTLWTPKTPDKSAMAAFMRDVNSKFNTQITDYHQLWEWSVENHEAFWNHWWNYVNPIASKQPHRTLINSDLFELMIFIAIRRSKLFCRGVVFLNSDLILTLFILLIFQHHKKLHNALFFQGISQDRNIL